LNIGKRLIRELALIIPVDEAEILVSNIRSKYDPSAPVGIPAHITINYPFTPDISIHYNYLQILSSAFANIKKFTFKLDKICEFPNTIYLSPRPTKIFIRIIKTITALFPESQPYKGEYSEIIPHLTLAQVKGTEINSIKAIIANQLNANLPIKSIAKEIWLIEDNNGLWDKRFIFPLKN
jgi:2'-5' RNA ligase